MNRRRGLVWRDVARCTGLVLLLPFVAATAGEVLTLDDMEYPGIESARKAWVPDEGSQPVGLAPRNGGSALQMVCNFVANERRSVYDLSGQWDLSRFNRFTFDIRMERPGALKLFIIYFRSTGGWLYGQFYVQEAGWQTVNMPKSMFHREEEPAGWHDITGVRLSAWRGDAVDTVCLVDALRAHADDVLVLKRRARCAAASRLRELLGLHGVHVRDTTESEVRAAGLPEVSLVILPRNPDLDAALCRRLTKYVQAGGKLIAFRHVPPPLAQVLGVRVSGALDDARRSRCATVRLTGGTVKGLPETLVLSPSELGVAAPAAEGTALLGTWLDAAGVELGCPAVALSSAGAFVSFPPPAGDPVAAARFLLALVGHFVPEAWRTAAQAAATPARRIGHLERDQLRSWLESRPPRPPRRKQALALLDRAEALRERIDGAVRRQDHIGAATLAVERDQALEQAYLLGHRARAGEFRAWWEHSGQSGFADWDTALRVLSEAGFNAVITNCLRGGSAQYPSTLLPVSPVVEQKGDQVAAAVAAGRKYGVEVHIWKVNFWGWDSPKPFVERMRAEGRFQVAFDGKPSEWLCPSHPANRELEVGSMVEVASRYAVDGVHFDYIRYEGSNYCFCAGCRERFEQDRGLRVANWPADTRTEALEKAWVEWRAEQISRIVRETALRVRAVRPGCRISAAVFPEYPSCAQGAGQDWVRWAREGWVDFLCPMVYSDSNYTYARRITAALRDLRGAVPVYPGIHVSRLSMLPFTTSTVAGQIAIARNLGLDGFTLFNYGDVLAGKVLPGLQAGITQGQTYVPNRGPSVQFTIRATVDAVLGGAHVDKGKAFSCTVAVTLSSTREPVRAFRAQVVLENADGEPCQQLGAVSTENPGASADITISEPGLYRVAAVGTFTGVSGVAHPFTARSQPIVCERLPPASRQLLTR